MKHVWIMTLALVGAAQAAGKEPDSAVEKGLNRAGNAIERGLKAAGRGVERGAKAVQRSGKKVSDKVEKKVAPERK